MLRPCKGHVGRSRSDPRLGTFKSWHNWTLEVGSGHRAQVCCAFWQMNFASKTPQSIRRPVRGVLEYRSCPAVFGHATKTILLRADRVPRHAKVSPRVGSHAACPRLYGHHLPNRICLTTNECRDRPWRSRGWLHVDGVAVAACRGDAGNCETRIFFAFVLPIFRLVNEPASRLTLIGSGRADRAGATNARRAVRI